MNVLSRERQLQILRCLTDGCGIRATERICGCNRRTVLRLLVQAGENAAQLHDEHVRGVECRSIELDEMWTFCAVKQGRKRPDHPEEYGDTYLYLAADPLTKIIVSRVVGKRDHAHTDSFVRDLADRLACAPQLNTDGWPAYVDTIRRHFADRGASHAQIVKQFASDKSEMRRYGPPVIVSTKWLGLMGFPKGQFASTSRVERLNLNVRVFQKRWARLSLCFSKKLENLVAAAHLFTTWHNFSRAHGAFKKGVTPAMCAGLASEAWPLDAYLA